MQAVQSSNKQPVKIWDILSIQKNEHAGFMLRFSAFLIDFSIVILPCALVSIYFINSFMTGSLETTNEENVLIAFGLFIIFLCIIIPISFIYQFICEISKLSSTIGYRIMKIHTIDKFGRKPSAKLFFLRTLTKFLTFLGFTPFLLLICGFTKNKQNVQDLTLGTFVIKKNTVFNIYCRNIDLLLLHEVDIESLQLNESEKVHIAKLMTTAKFNSITEQSLASQMSQNAPSTNHQGIIL